MMFGRSKGYAKASKLNSFLRCGYGHLTADEKNFRIFKVNPVFVDAALVSFLDNNSYSYYTDCDNSQLVISVLI